jgi:hypothetical protein
MPPYRAEAKEVPMNVRPLIVMAGFVPAILLVSACVVVRDEEEGDAAKVSISTPVGGLLALTGENAGNTGLPVYPGAQFTRNTHDGDVDRANVSIGTPWFGLHVIAAEYESRDSPERILSFYREEMKTFGAVTECRGEVDFRDDRAECRSQSSSEDIQLVAGTEERHRIVSVKPRADGSEFALVSIQMGN